MAETSTQTNDAKNTIDRANLVRLSVNLNSETADALKELAASRGVSATEAVRRAISLYKFLEDESKSGRHIQTTDSDRSTVRELVLI